MRALNRPNLRAFFFKKKNERPTRIKNSMHHQHPIRVYHINDDDPDVKPLTQEIQIAIRMKTNSLNREFSIFHECYRLTITRALQSHRSSIRQEPKNEQNSSSANKIKYLNTNKVVSEILFKTKSEMKSNKFAWALLPEENERSHEFFSIRDDDASRPPPSLSATTPHKLLVDWEPNVVRML